MRRLLLSLILVLLFSPPLLFGLSEEKQTQQIKWKSIENSSGYLVEVVKESKLNGTEFEYQKIVEQNFAELLLIPGNYFYRVTVLNRFKKSSSQTQWQKLIIKSAKRPYFQYLSQKSAYEGDSLLIVETAISNYVNGSKIFIKSKDIEIIPLLINKEHSNNMILKFKIDELEAGFYNIVCINPSGLDDFMENAIEILPRFKPKFKRFSSKKFYCGEILGDLEIIGKGFEEGLIIDSPIDSNIIISNIKTVGTNLIHLWLDLTDTKPGTYFLIIKNPSGMEVQTKPIEVVSYENGLRPDKVKTGFGIVARLPIVFGDMPDVDTPGIFTGFGFSIESDFGGLTPLLKWMGYSLFFEYKELGVPYLSDIKSNYEMIHYINLGNSYYLTTRFDSPLNLFTEVGLGISIIKKQFDEHYTGLDNDSLLGLYTMLGVGIDISIIPELIFRIGSEVQFSYSEDGQHLQPEVYVELGYRFRNKRKLTKYVTEDDLDSLNN